MRAFIGVPLPCPEPLATLLDELRRCGDDLKVVDARQLHVTLRFLGDVRDEESRAAAESIRGRALPSAFDITLRDVGAFPDWRKLNIIWAGLDDASGTTARLHALVQEATAAIGAPPEDRAYRPHLTIARKRGDRAADRARDVLGPYRGRVFGTARVDRFNLYRSTLTPQGPVYDVVEAFPL